MYPTLKSKDAMNRDDIKIILKYEIASDDSDQKYIKSAVTYVNKHFPKIMEILIIFSIR